MAYTTKPKGPNDFSLIAADGTGTPVTLNITNLNTDFSYSFTGSGSRRNVATMVQSLGTVIGAVEGEVGIPTVSFSVIMSDLSDAAAGSALDFFRKKGFYSSNVSTMGAGNPYTVDLRVTVESTNFTPAGSADDTFTLEDCCLTSWSFNVGSPVITLTFNFEQWGATTGDAATT